MWGNHFPLVARIPHFRIHRTVNFLSLGCFWKNEFKSQVTCVGPGGNHSPARSIPGGSAGSCAAGASDAGIRSERVASFAEGDRIVPSLFPREDFPSSARHIWKLGHKDPLFSQELGRLCFSSERLHLIGCHVCCALHIQLNDFAHGQPRHIYKVQSVKSSEVWP